MANEFIARNGVISKGNVVVSGSLSTSGSFTTTGTITAQTLVVQTITSSISSITGSTNFGTLSSNTHTFTGSLNVTGALYVTTGSVGIGTVSPSQLFEVVGGEIKAGRVDSSSEGGQVSFGRSTDNATAWYIDTYGNTSSPIFRFVDVAGAAVRMVISGSNVGIGTSSPTSVRKLTVAGGAQFTYTDNGGASFNIVPGATGQAGADFNLSYYTGTGYGPLTFTLGGSEKMRIGSDGYIGIGTTSPSSKVTIVRDSPYNTGDQSIRIRATDGDGYNLWMGASTNGYATIQSYRDNVGGAPLLLNPLNGGNVGIGLTDPQIKLHVVAGSGTGTTTVFCIERGGGYGGTFFKQYYNSGTDWGLIIQSSTNADGVKLVQGATSWTSNSDERLKDIIEPISNATNKINTLRAVIGKYKTDNEDKRRLFLIAQDVNNVLPEAVDIEETEDAYMGIRYQDLTPVLVKAIQELEARVQELENK